MREIIVMVTHGRISALSDNNTRDRKEKKAEGKGNKFLATETETARKKYRGSGRKGGNFAQRESGCKYSQLRFSSVLPSGIEGGEN